MTTIPRAEIDAVMERYNDCWAGRDDLPVTAVREVTRTCRANADDVCSETERQELLAEATDLDALADRYEREVTR